MNAKTLFAHWERWWLAPIEPHALAIIRICTGTVLAVAVLSHLPHVSVLFSTSGVALALHAALPILPPYGAYALFFLLLTGCIGLALGYRMRLSILLIVVCGTYFWNAYLHLFPATFHRLTLFILLVLLWSGADKTLSLRMRYAQGSWYAWERVCALPERLLMVQMLMTYVGSGWQKFALPAWQNGDVLYYGLLSDWGTPLAHALVTLPLPHAFYDAVVQAVIYFEFVLPFALLYPPSRKPAIICGILFHTAVLLLLSIWSFLVLLVPLYITLYPPKKVRALFP